MMKTYQLDFQKIRRKTQIKDISSFEIYLKNVFSDLAKRDWLNKEGKGIEKITFIEYMNLPFIVGEKLFHVIEKNKNGNLSQNEFVSGIINLYVGGLEETQRIIFNMLDFDLDGKIIQEDSRLIISFIKNLANPPEKVMKLKPRTTLDDEENLEEINLIIKNFFNNKNSLSFEEYKYNIENINSDVFFLFICFLYNNKPFNDSSIKILKLLNKNSHLMSSVSSSNFISCYSDDCTYDSKFKIKSPSNVFKSFIWDLVDIDLDEIQRDCANNSLEEDNNIDEGINNNLIREGTKKINLPSFKPKINLFRLKGNKDYLVNNYINQRNLGCITIKKTYENFIKRIKDLVVEDNDLLSVNLNNSDLDVINLNNKRKILNSLPKCSVKKFNDSKNYINEDENFDDFIQLENKNILFENSGISGKKRDQVINFSTVASSKINKSKTEKNQDNSIMPIVKKVSEKGFEKKNDTNSNGNTNYYKIPKIKISDLSNNKEKTYYYRSITDKNINKSNNLNLSSESNLSISGHKPNLNGSSNNILSGNDSNSIIDEFAINDVVYENYVFKSRSNKKLKKYYVVLIGMDLFYFSNSKKKKLRGMHNLSGSYVYTDENIIKVREENGKNEPALVLYFPFKLYFKKKSRIYYCPSEEEANLWIKYIRQVTKFREVKEFYNFGEDLGSGKFGKVKLAYNKNNKNKVAIKSIDKSKLKGTEFEMVKTEIEIMKFCKNKNIVRLIDNFEDMENIYLVLEYLAGGNLNFYLSRQQTLLSEEKIKILIKQIASGINYLHNFGIVHRDLKPENTMMSDTSDFAQVKIVDFGLSKILGINEKSNEAYGTLSYAAPEVIQKNDYNNKIDIWSLGVIMYFLICGYLPFNDKYNNVSKIASDINKAPIKYDSKVWNRISNTSKDLVMKCLERDIKKRLNIVELMEHPWFIK